MIRGKFLTSRNDISQIIELRKSVFIDELGLGYKDEIDRFDEMAVYALIFDDDNSPVATGRLYIDEDCFKIGKLCVKKDMRNKAIGDFVMRMLLYRAEELNAARVSIISPIDLVKFFSKYGFEPSGEKYDIMGTAVRNMSVTADKINIEGTCGGHSKCAGCEGNCEDCQNG